MSVTLDIPDEIANIAQKEAKLSGASLETVLLSTLAARFAPDFDPIQAEMDAWEEAADEDMTVFLQNESIK